MGLARSIARATIAGYSGIATPEKWLVDFFHGGDATPAGVRVDEETALSYSAFFAGVRVISEDIGSLPLPLYERLEPRGKRRATEHPLYSVLHDQANPLMPSMALRETMQGHALTWGDGTAYVVRNGSGQVTELWPLRPDRIHPEKGKHTGPGRYTLRYRYEDHVNQIFTTLLPDEVLHLHGLGFDGIRGYSVVAMARNSIGLGLATETYGSSFFGNGSRPGGVLQHPGAVSDGARARMKADWENLHKGLDRAQRIAILEEGVTWQQTGIPPEDAQFLETRKMQVTEMSRWLRLPPHKIGDLERSTFSNIESQQIDYVSSALMAWLVRWEQAIFGRLLEPTERRRFFAEHLVDHLLRGDTQARYQAYATGRQWGWLNADDIREKENLNPIPERRGEVYLVPLNMVAAPTPDDVADEPEAEPGAGARTARLLRGRSIQGRRRIGDAFAPLIVDTDERLAKLERAEVSSLVRRHLERARSVSAFLAEAELLYQGLITERSIERWGPVMAAYTAEVIADARDDVGYEDDVDLSRWVQVYVASHVAYRAASAVGQLRAVLAGADDPAAAVGERLDKWVTERPERTARWETNQLPNAAARETWREAGVTHLRWVTVGDDCPYCSRLDGKVVGIIEPFMAAGDAIADGDQELVAKRNTYHPPMHPGCDCQVVPDR